RIEAFAERIRQPAQRIPQRLAVRVGVAERPTKIWGETKTEDRTEVALRRRAEHALVQATRGLVHERKREPLDDVAVRRSRADAEQLVNTRIRRALLALVLVEAGAAALALQARLHQERHGARCRP